MPAVRVRFRGVPFSAGRVHRSPRAETATRLPFGPRSQDWIVSEASTSCGRRLPRSPGTSIETGLDTPFASSHSQICGPYWKTIFARPPVSGPIAGHEQMVMSGSFVR